MSSNLLYRFVSTKNIRECQHFVESGDLLIHTSKWCPSNLDGRVGLASWSLGRLDRVAPGWVSWLGFHMGFPCAPCIKKYIFQLRMEWWVNSPGWPLHIWRTIEIYPFSRLKHWTKSPQISSSSTQVLPWFLLVAAWEWRMVSFKRDFWWPRVCGVLT